MPQKMTLQQFGAAIKAKYPDYAKFGDEEIGTRMLAKFPQYQENIEPFQSPRYPSGSATAGQVAQDQAAEVLTGVGNAITSAPGALLSAAKFTGGMIANPGPTMGRVLQGVSSSLPSGAEIRNAPAILAHALGNPESQAWKNAAQFAGSNLVAAETPNVLSGVGQLASALKNKIPSTARAGANFQTVMGAAKNMPLDLTAADDIALRAQELGGRGTAIGRGSSLPKVMRDYLRTRETQPTMTYEVGRDFSSSAGRLSSAEAQAANPVMQRQVAQLAKALNESNRQAAVKAGVGDLYDAAMREYRLASGIKSTKEALAAVLKNKGVQAAAGTGLTYGLYKAIVD